MTQDNNSPESQKEAKLLPLQIAADRIAALLQAISLDDDYFVNSDGSNLKKLDAKLLKDFSSVIKELASVICELNGISADSQSNSPDIRIEFDSSASELSE